MVGSWFYQGSQRPIRLEEQIQTLLFCGVTLAPDVSITQLTQQWPREMLEANPYEPIFFAIAPYSPELAHLDLESIYTPEPYLQAMRAMVRMAKGALPLDQWSGDIDPETGTGWVAFSLEGRRYRWPVDLGNGEFDRSLLVRLAQLHDQRRPGRHFAVLFENRQQMLLSCVTPHEAGALRDVPVTVSWLE
jgi:hypothetical protein